MNASSLVLTPELRALFERASTGGTPVQAIISNNVSYVAYLEHGTARMAAHPMIGPYLGEYRAILEGEIQHAFTVYPDDPQRALEAGVASAALAIMRAIADRTAVDTGRAKGAWVATLPDGSTKGEGDRGPAVTSTAQRAKNRAAKNIKKKQRETATPKP